MGRPTVDPVLAQVIADVDAHQGADAREHRARAVILEQLAGLERPFDRHASPTHVTASAIVVGQRGVLLHRHRRLLRWLQPGGHLDPGETPAAGALREGEEETGLDLSHPPGGSILVHLDVHDAADDHVHLDVRYLLLGPDRDPAPPPGESPEVAWFTWSDAVSVADTALVGALRSARRLIAVGAVDVPGGIIEEDHG